MTLRRARRGAPRVRQDGVTMIEVLVALVISVIGLLGLMALQMRAYAAESESYQRAQAAILLQDLANRLGSNAEAAADYVAADVGIGEPEDCTAAPDRAARDLCEWGNLLRGAAEVDDGQRVGAMAEARGCVTNPETDVYVVAVVWLGTTPTAAPATACGRDQYGDEALRRAVTTVVRIPRLDG